MTEPSFKPKDVETGNTVVQFNHYKKGPAGSFGGGGGGSGGGQGSGAGGGGNMEPKDYTDIRIGEAYSRIDASHQVLEAKIDTLGATIGGRLDAVPTRAWTVTVLIALFGALLAAFAFAGTRFDSGVSVSSALGQRMEKIETTLGELGQKIDQLQPAPTAPSN